MTEKKCIGFTLIEEYPGSKKEGTFEPYTTGEFMKYPKIWKPVYQEKIRLSSQNKFAHIFNGGQLAVKVLVDEKVFDLNPGERITIF